MFLVVSYDIPDDRRRTRLHRHLKGFGMRIQYSVFECVLDEPEVARLQTIVRQTIKRGEDHVRYYLGFYQFRQPFVVVTPFPGVL
jgi:CRISPR-associated protein Cas2